MVGLTLGERREKCPNIEMFLASCIMRYKFNYYYQYYPRQSVVTQ